MWCSILGVELNEYGTVCQYQCGWVRGSFSPHGVLQMLHTAVLFTRMVLLLCLCLYAFFPLLQFTYFTLPCLVLQDQHKAEETVHPKIPLHFILCQPHTHVVRLFTELHLPPNTQVLEQGGRQGALQCPVQCSTRPPPSPQLYLLALLSLPRHARTQQGLVKL